MKRLQLKLSDELYTWLQEYASRSETSMSDVIRILLGQLRDKDADLIRIIDAYEDQQQEAGNRGRKQF